MVSTLQHIIWGIILFRCIELFSGSKFSYITLAFFIILTLIPDSDFGIFLFHKNSVDHRTYFHNLFSTVLIGFMGSVFMPLFLSFMAVFLHLLLDLFDGRGIPMFFPFSKKRQIIYKVGQEYEFPIKLVYEGNPYLTSFSIIALIFVSVI